VGHRPDSGTVDLLPEFRQSQAEQKQMRPAGNEMTGNYIKAKQMKGNHIKSREMK
jgi:hypothetical protein